jgi:hypothetical protein
MTLTCKKCGASNTRLLPYSMTAPDKCDECDEPFQKAAPVLHEPEGDEEAAFRRHMAFNVEAVRSGLFNAAMDIADTMRGQNVPHADAILTTAAVEFAAQLWTQVMIRAGHPPKKVREELQKQVHFFHRKHLLAEQQGAKPVTRQ